VPTIQNSGKEDLPIRSDLIYDMGMYEGEDTEFYLASGYRVLAIEADPDLVAKARARFLKDLSSGRLSILNLGISDEPSIKKFWICEPNRNWNSFYRDFAARNGCAHHSIDVPTERFGTILREHGIPLYLKIDIEGSDGLCLSALLSAPLPKFISVEDGGLDGNSGVPRVLANLHSLGYRYFNFVSQGNFRPLFRLKHYKPKATERIVNSLAYGRLRIPVLSKLIEPMTYESALARRNGGRHFMFGSSGPWGQGIPGGWVTFEEACKLAARIRAEYFSQPGVDPLSFWCDWHATTDATLAS